MAVSLTQILQTFETIETFRKTILRVKILVEANQAV